MAAWPYQIPELQIVGFTTAHATEPSLRIGIDARRFSQIHASDLQFSSAYPFIIFMGHGLDHTRQNTLTARQSETESDRETETGGQRQRDRKRKTGTETGTDTKTGGDGRESFILVDLF